mmetsp:Transcript_40914/g.162023  ORF Transcript_40914/g.162023 Transcript_40914/m.162023 type:complete len:301 (+) Transcript_40914:1982-2884(+)
MGVAASPHQNRIQMFHRQLRNEQLCKQYPQLRMYAMPQFVPMWTLRACKCKGKQQWMLGRPMCLLNKLGVPHRQLSPLRRLLPHRQLLPHLELLPHWQLLHNRQILLIRQLLHRRLGSRSFQAPVTTPTQDNKSFMYRRYHPYLVVRPGWAIWSFRPRTRIHTISNMDGVSLYICRTETGISMGIAWHRTPTLDLPTQRCPIVKWKKWTRCWLERYNPARQQFGNARDRTVSTTSYIKEILSSRNVLLSCKNRTRSFAKSCRISWAQSQHPILEPENRPEGCNELRKHSYFHKFHYLSVN